MYRFFTQIVLERWESFAASNRSETMIDPEIKKCINDIINQNTQITQTRVEEGAEFAGKQK